MVNLKPQTNYCPFCKNDLIDYWRSLNHIWYCKHCKCNTDKSMPAYVIICCDPDNLEEYLVEFAIDEFYVRSNYYIKETILNMLSGPIIVSSVSLPFRIFDLEACIKEDLIKQFKLYFTFS